MIQIVNKLSRPLFTKQTLFASSHSQTHLETTVFKFIEVIFIYCNIFDCQEQLGRNLGAIIRHSTILSIAAQRFRMAHVISRTSLCKKIAKSPSAGGFDPTPLSYNCYYKLSQPAWSSFFQHKASDYYRYQPKQHEWP